MKTPMSPVVPSKYSPEWYLHMARLAVNDPQVMASHIHGNIPEKISNEIYENEVVLEFMDQEDSLYSTITAQNAILKEALNYYV